MKKALALRWIGLGLGTLAGAVWLFILIAHLVGGEDPYAVEGAAVEGALLAALVLACAVGVGLAWWRARLGGVVLAVAGVALCVFAYVSAERNQWVALLVSGAPFTVAGVLLLVGRGERAGPVE